MPLVTRKDAALVAVPYRVLTWILPVGASGGTRRTILVPVTVSGTPIVPPNETCRPGAPKRLPLIVTTVPTGPDVGEKPEIVGGDVDAAIAMPGATSTNNVNVTAAIPKLFISANSVRGWQRAVISCLGKWCRPNCAFGIEVRTAEVLTDPDQRPVVAPQLPDVLPVPAL